MNLWLRMVFPLSQDLLLNLGNFPAQSHGKRVIRADGLGGLEVLEAILKYFPLDTYDTPAYCMEPVPCICLLDSLNSDCVADVSKFPGGKPPIWASYESAIESAEGKKITLSEVERFQQLHDLFLNSRFKFYERAKNAFAVVATSEAAIYANLILKKGVISSE